METKATKSTKEVKEVKAAKQVTPQTPAVQEQPQPEHKTLTHTESAPIATELIKTYGSISAIKAKEYDNLVNKYGKKNAIMIINDCKAILREVVNNRVTSIDREYLNYTTTLDYEYKRLLECREFGLLTEAIKDGFKSGRDFVRRCAKYVNEMGNVCRKVNYISSDEYGIIEGYEITEIDGCGVVRLLKNCYHNLAAAIKTQSISKGLSSISVATIVKVGICTAAYDLIKKDDLYIKGDIKTDSNLAAYVGRNMEDITLFDEKPVTLSAYNKSHSK